jgi:monothiol glutaredoxin
MTTEALIQQQLKNHNVLLYMKGTPNEPLCGFSRLAATILQQCHVPFEAVDVLEHQEIRRILPQISQWPTFPQLYIKGELIGGSDIMAELYARGELQQKLAQVKEN